jgi:hypothetical protein
MPAYEKKDEKEAPKSTKRVLSVSQTKFDSSGNATNVRWSTDSGSRGIKRVTPGADKQSRSR